MKDRACIQFLQWVLPQLHLRWPGFRKVRHQVCKRVERRIRELSLADLPAYQEYLQTHAAEWQVLDSLCRITISRFYRDRGVFDSIGEVVLPGLAQMAKDSGEKTIRCWCAGCASGEEPYTLMLVWEFLVKKDFPGMGFEIIATDVEPVMLERCRNRCYPASSVKDLPAQWLDVTFEEKDDRYCLSPRVSENVHFVEQDIRFAAPEGRFHLIFCRNLAFTYFNKRQQVEITERIYDKLVPGGAVVVGIHEYLPSGGMGFSPWIRSNKIYRKD